MTKYLLFPFLFFSSLFLTSCHGQEKSHIQKNNSEHKNTVEKKYIDPLFFIEGQLCQHVRKIYQDKSGNLWFGTNVYDLMRYDGNTLEYFDEDDGFGGGRVTGILEDKKGNVWFGTYGGLTKFDGKTFTNLPMPKPERHFKNDIWSIYLDQQGIFWVGSIEGIFQFKDGIFIPFPIPKATVKNPDPILSEDRITSIVEDEEGAIWFGTDGFGICKYDGKKITHITKKNGLPDNNISDLFKDKYGNIWIGTMFGGISRFDGKAFTNFTEKGIVEGEEISGIYEAKNGNIWFAAENHGVYFFDGKTFTNLYKKEGLPTNGILSIFEDREGRFWFGGWGGLFRYDGKVFFPVTKEGPWK